MSVQKGVPLSGWLWGLREQRSKLLRGLGRACVPGGLGQAGVRWSSRTKLLCRPAQVREEEKPWVPWNGLVVIGKKVELLGRDTHKPRVWDLKPASEHWPKTVLKGGSDPSLDGMGGKTQHSALQAPAGLDSATEISERPGVKRQTGAESTTKMTTLSRRESEERLRSAGDKVGTSGENLRSRGYRLGQNEELRLRGEKPGSSGERLVFRGERRRSSGQKLVFGGDKSGSSEEKLVARGERRRSTGEKLVSRGERRQSSGEKVVSRGERRQSTGEKLVSRGERRRSTGEKLVSRERRQSTGEKLVSRGERRRSSGEKLVFKGERRRSSGEKPRSSGEKLKISRENLRSSREKLKTVGEKLQSPGDELGSSAERRESNEKLSRSEESTGRLRETGSDETVTGSINEKMAIPLESVEERVQGIEEGPEADGNASHQVKDIMDGSVSMKEKDVIGEGPSEGGR